MDSSDHRERVIASERQLHPGCSVCTLPEGIPPEHQDVDFVFPMSGFRLLPPNFTLPVSDSGLPRGNLEVPSVDFRFLIGGFEPIMTESRPFSTWSEAKDTSPRVKDLR
ncbi:MAG: hypothetical protein LBQ54_15025 [Planctomycetaceae bacterium]|nr:hypothetical protein [Planctomycetaceae bacterium]